MAFEIPYQRQFPAGSDRTCGAAALAMVYASLGLEISQERIWEEIRPRACSVAWSARSSLLARHALGRGLSAAVIQASQPWPALQSCWASGIRVILNHRLRPDSPLGHFSVLAGLASDAALLHDPQLGPSRRLTRDELLRLWLPTASDSEIAGQVLVAIALCGDAPQRCAACHAGVPAMIECPGCSSAFPPRPFAALGCVAADCGARLWKYLFCPYCDVPLREIE
ncbi:MAG: hypothetical protein HUU20_05405 [Pirellulales bacterium]|nr:hypothetical protein [Pirellulales bacterium]